MPAPSTEGLRKKQSLLSQYWHKLKKLKEERSSINAKIKNLEEAFQQLIDVNPNDNQLLMFEDIDQYLKEEVEAEA